MEDAVVARSMQQVGHSDCSMHGFGRKLIMLKLRCVWHQLPTCYGLLRKRTGWGSGR